MPERPSHTWRTRLADIGMILFGAIMAITPLALWVAPTKSWFYFVLELFVISGFIVWYLSRFESSAAEHQRNQRLKRSVYDRIVHLLQNLGLMKRNAPSQAELKERAAKHRRDIQERKAP
ncbi:MAG: hypothetical protein HQ483_02455 [Rhodospirillales bacterium]|nr:hypothetical protein [Rhodospirillales bacterium]